MSTYLQVSNLILQVILPYLKQKLDHWFEETRHKFNIGHHPKVGVTTRVLQSKIFFEVMFNILILLNKKEKKPFQFCCVQFVIFCCFEFVILILQFLLHAVYTCVC